jgi:curved DNA-binding protein CbpA
MSHLPVIDRRGQLGRAPPTNLCDLLGARPDGDTEELKIAFRRALKVNHPDLHPGDPDAPVRVSGIVRAYAILRDPQERAAYDRALGLGCEPPPRARRSIFETYKMCGSDPGLKARDPGPNRC